MNQEIVCVKVGTSSFAPPSLAGNPIYQRFRLVKNAFIGQGMDHLLGVRVARDGVVSQVRTDTEGMR